MDRAEKLQKIQQIIDGVRLRIDQGDAVSDEEIEILVAQNPILASELGEGLKKLTANCQTAQHRESEPVSPPHEVIPDSDVQKLRDRSWPELISSDIGQFKMIEELSRGGQGIVFKVRQEHPVRREAALKLLLEVEDPNVARFQIESGALARMDHPNVAKVIQAGTTKNKQPYFLMEYVPGIKITKYCDENRLTIEERLLVFIDVCKGIQHAHQKGIIHRDIKPSNVLVMDQISGDVTNPHQKKGRIPKVIDFGLAKPTDLRLSEKTVDTQFGGIIGTRLYSSPEQTETSAMGIDTRTDVYSLGVLLCEIIIGSIPFKTLADVMQGDPPLPSDLLRKLDPVRARRIAHLRGTDSKSLMNLLAEDLDWIVLKAIQKDRNDRYDSASALASDIIRYLKHEPVTARKAHTLTYWMKKFIKRNKVAVIGVLLFVVVLLSGIAVTTFAMIRAQRAETKSRHRFEVAVNAIHQMGRRTAEERLRDVRDIDQTRLDLLNDGRQLYEILLEEEGSNQKVRHELGRICGDLGNVNLRLGKTAEAEQNHRNSIQWLAPLVDEVPDEPTFRRDLSITYKKLADLYAATGRAGEALANYRLSLDFKEELARIYPDNAQYRGDLGVGYADLGKSYAASSRPKEAEAAYREALSQLQKLADPEPVHRGNEASCWNQLGSLYHTTGRLKEAEPCYKNALSLWERLTAEHPGNPDYRRELGGVHNNLGFLYIDQKRFIEAIKSLESAKTIRKALVADYPDVVLYQNDLAATHNNLGLAFHNNHEPDKAKEAHQAALQIREPLVFRFPKIIQFRFELAGTYGNIARLKRDYGNQKELEDALQWYEKIPRLLEKDQHNPEARRILCLAHWGRAQTLGRLKRYEESLDHSELALKFDDGRRRVELELGRMLTYVQLGDYVHASENAKDLAEDISLPGPVVYDLACVFSLSFAAALKDSKVAQDEREGLAEPYAIRSIGLLKLAVQRGYKDVDHMKKDSDLDPLRGRKDFKEFIADLESRLKKEVAKASK